jgi:hypothetical protein
MLRDFDPVRELVFASSHYVDEVSKTPQCSNRAKRDLNTGGKEVIFLV